MTIGNTGNRALDPPKRLKSKHAKMQLPFEVPNEIGETILRVVPDSERSVLETKLLAAESRRRMADAVAVCEGANRWTAVVAEDAAFEQFDDRQP